jgi:hypothetical protein
MRVQSMHRSIAAAIATSSRGSTKKDCILQLLPQATIKETDSFDVKTRTRRKLKGVRPGHTDTKNENIPAAIG